MSEYNTNQDGQWKTSEQWRAEEANDHSNPKKNKNGGRGKYVAKLAASAVAFGLIAGLVMQGVTYGFSRAGIGNGATQLATTKTTSSSSSTSSNDLSGVSKNVMPSIVSITGKFETTSQSWFGQTQSSESEGVGSGIIIGKKDGKILIVTNNHVVADAKSLSVGFVDGKSASATIRGTDSDADLAVVEVDTKNMKSSTLKKIAVITLGDSSKLQTGERAIAIGNALGYGQSVTGGYISALNRQVQLTDKTMTLIQTDAAINPGNSGGALLNMKGELIGINSAKYASAEVEGMGYAIPVATAQPILDNLMTRETRDVVSEDEAGYLGVSVQDVSEEASSYYGIPSGAYLAAVEENGAAAKAGIKQGDIITKFDGLSISSASELKSTIAYYKEGETVDVTYMRANNGEYEEHTVSVTLAKSEAAAKQNAQQKNSTDSQSGNPKDGLTVSDPDADQSEDQQQDESQYYGNMQDFFNEFFGY